jgi:hypothetical protein
MAAAAGAAAAGDQVASVDAVEPAVAAAGVVAAAAGSQAVKAEAVAVAGPGPQAAAAPAAALHEEQHISTSCQGGVDLVAMLPGS